MTTGYAYKNERGAIDIKTVSPNMQAAMVNAIYVNALFYESTGMPMNHWSYDMIKHEFKHMLEEMGGALIKVSVTEMEMDEEL